MGAYAWLAFFISLFAISMVWVFTIQPITTYCINIANQSNFPQSDLFYNFLNVVITLFPVIAVIILTIGALIESYIEELRGW